MCTHQAHMPSQVAVAFLGLRSLQKGSHRPSQLRAFAPLGKATFSGPRRIAERNCPITSLSHCPRVHARRVKVVVLAIGNPKPQNPALPLMQSFLQKGLGSSGWWAGSGRAWHSRPVTASRLRSWGEGNQCSYGYYLPSHQRHRLFILHHIAFSGEIWNTLS